MEESRGVASFPRVSLGKTREIVKATPGTKLKVQALINGDIVRAAGFLS